jgi:7-dehydrocholesterol reductase
MNMPSTSTAVAPKDRARSDTAVVPAPLRWRRTAAHILHTTILPLSIMLVCPVLVFLLWYTCVAYGGSFAALWAEADWATLVTAWPWPSWLACKIVLLFVAGQALLKILLPGRTYFSPVTPAGEQVAYKINGLPAWVLTNLFFYLGGFQWHWFAPTILYDQFGPILSVGSLASVLLCGLLYAKGVWFPSGEDAGRSGNWIFDYFWGVELHPRLFGFDLKQFVNCHLAMMSWSVLLLSFMAKQYETESRVSTALWVTVILQMAYLLRFYYWESGYLASLDVMHDRFGFYICWGICTWLPCVYTSQALYLVVHPRELGLGLASLLVFVGLLALAVTYDADAQRQRVRATEGRCTVWGRRPEVIVARYQTGDGQVRHNLLLVSGWWGVARHFHYLPELMLALAWTVPCGFDHLLPYTYLISLSILLVHRSFRDDQRCRAKYGPFWEEYCARVPWRILPGIF